MSRHGRVDRPRNPWGARTAAEILNLARRPSGGATVFEPIGETLPMACYCEREVEKRPHADARDGRGWSCGRPRCQPAT